MYASPRREWLAYALPPSTPAQTEAINGSHGWYHDLSEVPGSTRLDSFHVPGASVEVASHVYSEYTNSRTDFIDYLAFVRWVTPPAPDQTVAVLGRFRVTRGTDASAELIEAARTIEPIS